MGKTEEQAADSECAVAGHLRGRWGLPPTWVAGRWRTAHAADTGPAPLTQRWGAAMWALS